ncbi:contractile injection system tape measure protein [Sphingomonas sp. 28-63-12]|uniref:contractile injection system tape measure protein n=1 Tax=Sphingomonas sp. 28-63-12 TaxID=1970434 RepID=UPI0035A8CBD3
MTLLAPAGGHRIGKLDLRATIGSLDQALAIRPRIEALAARVLPDVLERVLDQAAPRHLYLRIARLDLDLGTVSATDLEQDIVAALEDALAEALRRALHAAEHYPSADARLIAPADAQLQGFIGYLASGLPSTIYPQAAAEPRAMLAHLVADQPGALIAMLRQRAGQRHVLERLILQIGADGLAGLLSLLAPGDAAIIRALIADILLAHRSEPLASAVAVTEPVLERLLWVATLELLLRDAGSQFNRRRFLGYLLQREARQAGLDFAALLQLLGAAIAQTRARMGFRSSLPQLVAELIAEQPALPDAATAPAPTGGAAGPTSALAAAATGDYGLLVALVRRLAGNRVAIEALVITLDPAIFAGLVATLDPANADLILAILDDIERVHQAKPTVLGSGPALMPMLRSITVQFLVSDAGSQFNRRRFLAQLIEGEARHASIDYPAMLLLLADALARQQPRLGYRSSLPAILGDLIAEVAPALQLPAADAVATALTAARRGDRAALIRLLRASGDDLAARATIIAQADTALLGLVVREIDPVAGPLLHRDVETLIALYAAGPFLALSAEGMARAIRLVGLHALLRRGAAPSARRAWRDQLMDGLAAATGTAPATLRAQFARAAAEHPLIAGDIATGWAIGPAVLRVDAAGSVARLTTAMAANDIELVTRLLRAAAARPSALAQLADTLDETARAGALAAFDAPNADAVLADIRSLSELHAAYPLARLDRADFAALLWTRALIYLAGLRGGRFDRRAFGQHMLRSIAQHQGSAPAALAQDLRRGLGLIAPGRVRPVAALIATLAPADRPGAGSDDQHRAIEEFLHSGRPPYLGRGLPALAASDRAWLAAAIRRVSREAPGAVHTLVARLLDWLLPDELLACLAPDLVGPAALLGGDTDDLAHWQQLFAALLRGERPAPPKSRRRRRRLDRLSAIGHWLDHGAWPWWTARGPSPAELLAMLPTVSIAELQWLFHADTPDRALARLRRAIEPLDDRARQQLFARIVPWATRAGGPLAPLLASRPAADRLTILLHAAQAALDGVAFDLERVAFPTTPPPSPPPAVAAPIAAQPSRRAGRDQLFGWLDGSMATSGEAAAFVRLFARLADAEDPALIAYLAHRRGTAAHRARWAALLPPEAIGGLVRLVAPTQARVLVDAAIVLAVAWRRAAPFGARRRDPGTIWALLLDFAAAPDPLPLPGIVAAMVTGLAGPDAALAARLRVRAQELAQQGGHVSLAAILRRAAARPEPLRPAPPRKPVVQPAAAATSMSSSDEGETGDPIYIGNAGLVLFSPYLPALFDRLGLLTTEDGAPPRLIDPEAQSRAVHLLQYLVDERLDTAEPLLVLNKLLCGIAPAEPVAASITPSQAELDLCDGLIGALIGNWPMLEGTSPAGLRETFLQREGRLLFGDDRWTLQVQRKTVDVLVDQIPWGFSMIFHRWMPVPVHVTW